jgi:tetratricopeptide (TPR) repeat protein
MSSRKYNPCENMPKSGELNRQQLREVYELYSKGALPLALSRIDELLAEFPHHPALLNLQGTLFTAMNDPKRAQKSYEMSLRNAPSVADTHYRLASAYLQTGRADDAIEHCELALKIQPSDVETHALLCQCLERCNRLEELQTAIDRAKNFCGSLQPAIQLREAELLRRSNDLESARRLLESPIFDASENSLAAERGYLLGDLCDRMGNSDVAFSNFEAANQIRAKMPATVPIDGQGYLASIDGLINLYSGSNTKLNPPPSPENQSRQPVFLIGFPRSGTTLLDTILRGHPQIQVGEEQPWVAAMETVARKFPGQYPELLLNLNIEQTDILASTYAQAQQDYAESESSLLVDKLPLNLVNVGLIQAAFPRAKFLFMQRHPLDCVLSCYMRNFELNEGMVHFLDLKNTARLYDRAMSLWNAYQSALSLNTLNIRYESLIGDLEGNARRILNFLDLNWDEQVLDYVSTAQKRTNIDTPSYAQVTRPLYQEANGRWQRYAPHLQSILPILNPWIEELGY